MLIIQPITPSSRQEQSLAFVKDSNAGQARSIRVLWEEKMRHAWKKLPCIWLHWSHSLSTTTFGSRRRRVHSCTTYLLFWLFWFLFPLRLGKALSFIRPSTWSPKESALWVLPFGIKLGKLTMSHLIVQKKKLRTKRKHLDVSFAYSLWLYT